MSYTPEPLGDSDIKIYVLKELDRIGIETENLLALQPKELHAEPKPRDRLIVFADGTDWNPGSGQGLYIYYGGAWHKLG